MDPQSNKWKSKSVKMLQEYLRARGVTFDSLRKAALLELCESAEKLGIEIDPDGLIEDRTEVINAKLKLSDGSVLPNPEEIQNGEYTDNIDILPTIDIYQINWHLTLFEEYDHSAFTDLKSLPSYALAIDGYVESIEFYRYPTKQDYIAIKGKVKPRTRDSDPITKLKHYTCWLIISSNDRYRIISALCVCKGG